MIGQANREREREYSRRGKGLMSCFFFGARTNPFPVCGGYWFDWKKVNQVNQLEAMRAPVLGVQTRGSVPWVLGCLGSRLRNRTGLGGSPTVGILAHSFR